ncbi:unnamed protein product [Ectocarpus sp. 6 AP-2014]
MGSQAIHAAVHGGSPDVLNVLLRLGANPNAADDDGETPLMIACRDPTKDRFGFAMANILLNGGADPSLSTHFGRTALSYAARSGHTDVMDLLLRVALSRLDQADKYGVTPLCCAVQGGHENSVSRLLSAGATSLRFAMELAVRFDQARILKMLLTAIHTCGGERRAPGGRGCEQRTTASPGRSARPSRRDARAAGGRGRRNERDRPGGACSRPHRNVRARLRERSGKRGCNRAHAAAGSSFPFSIVGLADRAGWFHHFS